MVECHLAKVDVEGSSPFSRSPKAQRLLGFFFFWVMVAAEGGLHNHLLIHFGGHADFRVRLAGALPTPARGRTLANRSADRNESRW